MAALPAWPGRGVVGKWPGSLGEVLEVHPLDEDEVRADAGDVDLAERLAGLGDGPDRRGGLGGATVGWVDRGVGDRLGGRS